MSELSGPGAGKAVDSIQQRLTSYACTLGYDRIPADVAHAAKVRIIDTLGALIGGFFGEPCQIARTLAAESVDPNGATVIGTRMKTTPDLAAFVNAATARYVELTDSYHFGYHGHPSDVITAVVSAAEHARGSGRDFITGVVLAYEVFCRVCDVFKNRGFDHTNFCCLATAVAAGKLFGLTPGELSHCISMAVVPNNILRQVRMGHASMFKGVAAGQAGRAGVFAAMLARAGMEGPHLPFEGKAGWCDHIAGERFVLDLMGGEGDDFKIAKTLIKTRPASGVTIASILAAEKIAPLNIHNVEQITVEVYEKGKERAGSGEHRWNPESKESADGSIPYATAVTLMDGTVTPRSYNDSHLWNPQLRALMQKIEVVENAEFTQAYNRKPQEHRTRVTVVMQGGQRLVGESGGDQDELAAPRSDDDIARKFRGLTEDFLGSKRAGLILDRLWHLEELRDVAEIPSAFIFI